MKFRDFLVEGTFSPSIDDNDIINTLKKLNVFYNRTKNEDGSLMYDFDNRYTAKYDGSLLTLYRHGNKIHLGNARNIKEIETTFDVWEKSYRLSDTELTDEQIDDIVSDLKQEKQNDIDDNQDEDDNQAEDDTEQDDKK